MLKVLLHGYAGKMGRVLQSLIFESKDVEIVGGVDPGAPLAPFPVFSCLEECSVLADVLIDFSTASAIPALLDYSASRRMPTVLCTTGLTEETLQRVETCSHKVALFRSANMSLGVHVMAHLLKQAAPILYPSGFDIEIIESHHRHKIDAPSGTALFLGESINSSLEHPLDYEMNRNQGGKRQEREMGFHSLRGGSIVGEHTVLFAGKDETLAVTHRAQSKEIFAVGAIEAGKFLKGKGPGLYGMTDLIGHVLKV